ncbi:methyltransferase domain-containing protein [Roseateles violae]|uniref:Methyltransferase domain-containing protein n=1 Tax=Roseateles violae TaxID=3058042 RepID=A0ABT8DVL4_9BURK|nr:methyltransferase domain-containing protein [Pelomonas sp. PFR6]MDN3920339.1 methyltransferase domain-containing protein [Pelomonas sp. PFR6]
MRSFHSFGDLRSLQPVDAGFGGGRGKPIDRHYIESFLARHADEIRGHVLEVGGDDYTRRFGGTRVANSSVLQAAVSYRHADFIADLANGEGLPDANFDCFICTQTLQYVFDLQSAITTIRRILAPGGVLLLTVPGISQISPFDRDRWGEFWRFTPQSVQRLLEAGFDHDRVEVAAAGNVLAATAFLHGLACEDLTPSELDTFDDRYPVLVTAHVAR